MKEEYDGSLYSVNATIGTVCVKDIAFGFLAAHSALLPSASQGICPFPIKFVFLCARSLTFCSWPFIAASDKFWVPAVDCNNLAICADKNKYDVEASETGHKQSGNLTLDYGDGKIFAGPLFTDNGEYLLLCQWQDLMVPS